MSDDNTASSRPTGSQQQEDPWRTKFLDVTPREQRRMCCQGGRKRMRRRRRTRGTAKDTLITGGRTGATADDGGDNDFDNDNAICRSVAGAEIENNPIWLWLEL